MEINVPLKVKGFACLAANKRVNTNDLLQVRRPFTIISLDSCTLCMGNDLFLHCPRTLELQNKLFRPTRLDLVSPRNIGNMLTISSRGLGNTIRDKVHWKITCIMSIWIVWQERNVRIFEDKWRTSEMIWDLVYSYLPFWASTATAFKAVL